jgi:nucleoside-diphosphate-sugar epimerase
LDAEDVVRSSTLDWTILRIAAALPVEPSFALSEARAQFSRVRQLFRTCPNNRIEFVHPADVGDALKAATIERAAIGMTLLIGGGDKNRFEIFDLTNDLFEAMGLGRFPVHAFGQEELYTDWLDTTESQSILNFQSRTYSQYLVETRAALGMTPIVLRPISPILRWILKRI